MTPTLCEACDHVVEATRKRPPTQWLCIKFPRLSGGSFVAPNVWVDQEPYQRCAGINAGLCPLWKKRRDGQTENGL